MVHLRFDVFQDDLMVKHVSDDHIELWTGQEEQAWNKCHEVLNNPERKNAMMLMMQVEKRFGNASHWAEALQLVDISGGIVDANVLVRAAAALLVVIKFRSTSRADESSVHEMLVIASSMSARAISMEDVCQEEMSLLTAMDFEIDLPTPVAWFRMFLVRFDILTEQAHRETIQNICGDGDLCIEKCVSAASLSASFGPKKMAASLLGLFLTRASLLPPGILHPGAAGSQWWMAAVEGARQRNQPFDEACDFVFECLLYTTQLEEHTLRDCVTLLMQRFGDEVLAALTT